MKKAIIRKNGVITNEAQMEESELLQWLEKHKAIGTFGSGPVYETSYNVIPAVYGAEGDLVQAEQVEEILTLVAPAEYEIEVLDVTDILAQAEINAQSLKYLAETDWFVIRETETGIPCPVEIKQERAAARARIVR